MTIIKLQTANFDITVVYDARSTKKARAYSFADMDDVEMPSYSVRGDDADSDKAWRAYNKLEVARMRENIAAAAEELAATVIVGDSAKTTEAQAHAVAVLESKLGFSRKAGCFCGCSAGFVSQTFGGHGLMQVSLSPRKVEAATVPSDGEQLLAWLGV